MARVSTVSGMAILTETQIWRRTRHLRFAGKRGKLTSAQAAHVRVAIAYLAIRYQPHEAFARALGLTPNAAWKVRSPNRTPSIRLALVVAELAGVGVDAVLFGLWPGDRCAYCAGTGRNNVTLDR